MSLPLPQPSSLLRFICTGCMIIFNLTGTDLEELARLDGASGDEVRIIDYIRQHVQGKQQVTANGSLLAKFGSGMPRTLLLAGVDEPGYVVSGIHEEGYLRLHPLTQLPNNQSLHKHFAGQHVRISTALDGLVHGVIAAPAVHFLTSASTLARISPDDLFVDIGASHPGHVRVAGIAILDRLTLLKEPTRISPGWLSAPWISSRSGASILMTLAQRFASQSPQGTVILAFAAQQHYGNAGLKRILRSIPADRVVLVAPQGDDRSAIAVTPTESYVFQNTILKLASRSEVSLERKSFHSISFGPFEDSSIWPENQQSVILLPAVRNPGTPVEAVNISELEALSDLLGQLIGLPSGRISDSTVESATSVSRKLSHPLPLHANPAVEYNIERLLEVAGVSGKEQDVRELIKKLLPDRLKKRVYTTENGNLIVRIGQGAEPSSIFIAHMDEIGYQVKTINPNGWISTVMRGGIIPNLFSWRPVVVHTARGPVQAAMTRPGNLDFGDITSNAFKKLGIKVGDSITAPKRYYKLFGNRISGRSLDNRLGCAVLLEAIHRIAPQANQSTHSVEFVFSVEEEIGLLGAKKLAAIKAPKRVYAVDTFVTSDSPLDEPLIAHAQLGNGPVLRALDESGLTPRNELIRVLELAKRRKIPIQTGVTAGGNDGAAFGFTDTVNIPIGFPLRYPHSAVETADLADARAAVDLIETLAQAELSGR